MNTNFKLKTNNQMKHKNSITRLTLAFASLLLVAVLSSCGERENVKENTRGFEPNINYYHDCRTGLCFAEIVQGNIITGHTCVPCDSVRRFLQPCH